MTTFRRRIGYRCPSGSRRVMKGGKATAECRVRGDVDPFLMTLSAPMRVKKVRRPRAKNIPMVPAQLLNPYVTDPRRMPVGVAVPF